MTDGVLLLERNFRHGESELRKEEEGIVSEAAGSARGGENFAIDETFGGQQHLAVSGEGERAAVAGGAEGDTAQAGQEVEIIAGVDGDLAGATGDIARILGKARGAYAGFASQGVDFEAGIVGEDESRGEAAVVLRLETGVAGEGRFILGRRGDFVEIRQRRDGEPAFGSGDREVAELAGVGGGSVESNRHGFILCGVYAGLGFL